MLAISAAALGAVARIRMPPNQGAIAVPSELNAWVSVRREDAVLEGPRSATYGLAATCNTVIPPARMMSAARNSGNDGTMAAGTNSNAPTAMVSSPATIMGL